MSGKIKGTAPRCPECGASPTSYSVTWTMERNSCNATADGWVKCPEHGARVVHWVDPYEMTDDDVDWVLVPWWLIGFFIVVIVTYLALVWSS